MSSMMQIGMSGLTASQNWLTVTSTNIANVNTPGFSRRTMDTMAMAEGGVQTGNMHRMTDQFVVEQMWESTTQVGYAATYASNMMSLETIITSDGGNLGMGLDNWFGVLSAAMIDPLNPAYRDDVMNASYSMVNQINSLNSNIQNQISQTNTAINASMTQINSLTAEIADLNAEISEGMNNGENVDSLLDQRDQAIAQLSEQLDISVVDNGNGTVNITLPDGQPLVIEDEASSMEFDATSGVVKLEFNGQVTNLPPDIGGATGALYEYYDSQLIPAQEFVDEFAVEFADAVNSVMVSGYYTDSATGLPVQGVPMFTYDPADPAGTLQVADGFTADMLAFSNDPNNMGDNQNLQDLMNIQNQTFNFASLGGGSYTLNDAYSKLYSNVSSETATARQNAEMAISIYDQAAMEWNMTSGVSLDEEAMNLMKYEQAYMANAKVISVSGELFDTILAVV